MCGQRCCATTDASRPEQLPAAAATRGRSFARPTRSGTSYCSICRGKNSAASRPRRRHCRGEAAVNQNGPEGPFLSACLRRIVRRRHSGPAFRLRLLGRAFAALTKAASLEPVPLIAGAAPHVGGCALHPGTHRSGPIAGKKVGGSYTSRERDNGAERTRILILSAQIDVSNPVFGFGPA